MSCTAIPLTSVWTRAWQQRITSANTKEYQNQTGDIRRGIGMSVFWYNTAVWANLPGDLFLPYGIESGWFPAGTAGETEIGQGADTAYTQMAQRMW